MIGIRNLSKKYGSLLKRLFPRSSSIAKMNELRVMVVGLGNLHMPGTRHSIGIAFVDQFAERFDAQWTKERRFQGYVSEIIMKDVKHKDTSDASSKQVNDSVNIILVKSKVPMNNNGKTVQAAAKFYEVPLSNIILVHDELERDVGKFNIKHGGSAKGHNGVRSCQECLKSDVMRRLWFGISRPSSKSQVVDYVLSPFTQQQLQIIDRTLEPACNLLMKFIEKISEDHTKAKTERITATG